MMGALFTSSPRPFSDGCVFLSRTGLFAWRMGFSVSTCPLVVSYARSPFLFAKCISFVPRTGLCPSRLPSTLSPELRRIVWRE